MNTTHTFHDLVSALVHYVHSVHPFTREGPPATTDQPDGDGDGDPRPDPPYWTYFIDNPISKDSK